jgi:hypothetical protein
MTRRPPPQPGESQPERRSLQDIAAERHRELLNDFESIVWRVVRTRRVTSPNALAAHLSKRFGRVVSPECVGEALMSIHEKGVQAGMWGPLTRR